MRVRELQEQLEEYRIEVEHSNLERKLLKSASARSKRPRSASTPRKPSQLQSSLALANGSSSSWSTHSPTKPNFPQVKSPSGFRRKLQAQVIEQRNEEVGYLHLFRQERF